MRQTGAEKTPPYVIVVAAIAAIAGILFGFDTGVISGAILFLQTEFQLSAAMNGVVVSAVLIGALLGAGFSGLFVDIFGRRRLLIVVACIFIVGTVGSALAQSLAMLITTRIIVGVAIGISSFTVPLYISEISPPKYRGMLVTFNQLAITIGILSSYGIDYIFTPSESWRLMFTMGVIPAVILLIGMIFLPESPRWMVLRGWVDKARETLAKVRCNSNIDQEIAEIHASIHQEQRADWRLIFQRWLRPAVWIGLGLAFFQQATGINTIIYYAPTIFKLAGFSSNTVAILATAGVGTANVLFTIVALPLIDRWGRRPLLLTGLTAMIISLTIMGFSFHSTAHSDLLGWLTLGSMVLYIAGFAISLGPIMWLIIAEVFPLEIRGFGTSAMVAASWLFNALVALSFLTLIDTLGAGNTFWLFGLISLLGWVFVRYYIPETKGVSLEHIEDNLRAGKSARQLADS